MSTLLPSTPRTPCTPRSAAALVDRRRNTIDGSPSSASSTPRKALGPVKQLMTIEQFQARHAAYFSHLHDGSGVAGRNGAEEGSESWLEEERRLGREKRAAWEAYLASSGRALGAGAGDGGVGGEGDKENRPASVGGERSAWRPLSLLSKKAVGHTRSASHDAPTRLAPLAPLGTRNRNTERDEPVDLFTPTAKRALTPIPRTARKALDVVVESSPVPSPSPSPEVSGAKSTYSWATEFSGETAELRTAAQYIREKSYEEEEMLDSPTKMGQRRKRIVALAHTVRQLEGVGSRDAEDPNFYSVLVKAWHGRNDDHAEPPPAAPTPKPTNALTDAPPPFLPPLDESIGPMTHFSDPTVTDSDASTSASTTLPLYHHSSPGFENSFSPAEASIITPAMPDMGFLPSLDTYPHAESSGAAQRTSSVRYSYASTLHDLALEGGAARGEAVMQEKKWLKSRAADGRWSNMFNPRPPDDFFPPGHMRPPSIAPQMQDVDENEEHEMGTPVRPLRKYATDLPVSRVPIADPGATPRGVPFPTSKPDAPSGAAWGLGLMGNWWSAPSPSGASANATRAEDEEDFQMGEDGTPLNFMDTPPPLATPNRSSGLLAVDNHRQSTATGAGTGIALAGASSSTRESSPFSADLEAAADADSTSASVTDSQEAQIGLAITTEAPVSVAAPVPVLASSVSALILAPLAAMSLPRPALRTSGNTRASSEYPSSIPYLLRKSLIHSRTSPPLPEEAEGQHVAAIPASTSCLSPLDRLTQAPTRTPGPTPTTAMATAEEAYSGGSAIGSSQSIPIPLPISPRHLAPVPALRLAPETYSPSPTASDSAHSVTPLVPLAPYNTISSSTTTTGLTDTPTTDEASLPFPFDTESFLRRPSATPPPETHLRHADTSRQSARRSSVTTAPLPLPQRASGHSASPSTYGAGAICRVPVLDQAGAAAAAGPVIAEASTGVPRAAKPSEAEVVLLPKPPRRSHLPRTMFLLGWIMPWCWIFGGWPLASPVPTADIEKGAMADADTLAREKGWWASWIAHPDPWVRRCRVCAVVILPTVAVLAIAAVIVLAILR